MPTVPARNNPDGRTLLGDARRLNYRTEGIQCPACAEWFMDLSRHARMMHPDQPIRGSAPALRAVRRQHALDLGIGKRGAPNLRALGRARRKKTHCLNGHEFDEENTYIYPGNDKRACLACNQDRQWMIDHSGDHPCADCGTPVMRRSKRCRHCAVVALNEKRWRSG